MSGRRYGIMLLRLRVSNGYKMESGNRFKYVIGKYSSNVNVEIWESGLACLL
jgi:hypothetical protein